MYCPKLNTFMITANKDLNVIHTAYVRPNIVAKFTIFATVAFPVFHLQSIIINIMKDRNKVIIAINNINENTALQSSSNEFDCLPIGRLLILRIIVGDIVPITMVYPANANPVRLGKMDIANSAILFSMFNRSISKPYKNGMTNINIIAIVTYKACHSASCFDRRR